MKIGHITGIHNGTVQVKLNDTNEAGNYVVGETVRIESYDLGDKAREDLIKLIWVLIGWTVKNKLYMGTQYENYMRGFDTEEFLKLKWKSIMMIHFEYVELALDKDVQQVYIPIQFSTMTTKELGEFYDKMYQWLCDKYDMTAYAEKHQQARERLGKYF